MALQRVMGFALLVICFIICLLAVTSVTGSDKDITPVIVLAPIGIYLMLTNTLVIG